MPTFCLFQNLNITDASKMKQYAENVQPITNSFGGEYVAMGGETQVKEGVWSPTMPVIIKFPTLEAANAWYNSEEYAPLKKLRESAGEFSAVFIEGV